MARYGLRVGVTAAVVALMGTGCAPDGAAPEVDPANAAVTSEDDGGNGKTGSGSSGSSDPNGPGTDDPVDEPTLSLPGLPIGGRTYLSIDGNHPDNQCANVNWIVESAAADLVSGIEVVVTGFVFDPEVFTVASAGCDDDAPPCPGFVFTADAQVCNLAVAPIPGPDTSLGSYRFALVGRVDCLEVGSEQCRQFRDAVAAEPGLSLGLDPPFTGTDDNTDGTDDSTDGTDGTGTNGTDTSTDGGDDTGGATDGGGTDGTDGTDGNGRAEEELGTGEGSSSGSDTGSGTDSGE